MERMIELMTAVTHIPTWWFIMLVLAVMVFATATVIYMYKYRKAKQNIKDDNLFFEAVSENFRKVHERDVKTISDLSKEIEQARKERNEFYEGQIRGLNERIKKATDHNREKSLHYAVRAGGSTDDITKAAKVYHRHLQGKE